MEEILKKAQELSLLLSQCDIVRVQKEAKLQFNQDEMLQQEIGAFNLSKLALMNESNKEKPDAEIVKKYQEQTSQSYEKIMQFSTMIKLNDAEIALQNLLNQINDIIQKGVSDDGGCSHDCAHCSGCH